jgi:hypothetical protein
VTAAAIGFAWGEKDGVAVDGEERFAATGAHSAARRREGDVSRDTVMRDRQFSTDWLKREIRHGA